MNNTVHNDAFQTLYHQLNRNTVTHERLSQCYSPDVQFTDPFHQVTGLESLTHYFTALYSNVESIRFEFHQSLEQHNYSIVRWTMMFSHPRINGGKTVSVEGCSELKWHNGLISAQRDFFDAGAMLYEHLPILGWAIRKLKDRMQ